ncbi:MAG: T9SS type A sorting domain-containing protein [Ignavibacteriae bacterium]|nr:T9SS type A sorting domain-containing protein [Ignavibacteriota bacterium]
MKPLIIFITLLVVTLPQLSFAEEEVIWETEVIGGLNEVQVSPLGEVFYNTNDSIIEVRSIEDGRVVDAIIFPNTTRLDQISISADGRFMVVSGQTKYTIIYDLFERREVKRITTIAYEREEYGNNVVYEATRWISSSISPDGTKFTGIATARNGEMTNFVVIDISTEKVLYEQRRIIYDHFNPEKPYQKWQSTEYSPDGKYIVNQLEFKSGSDSVYIFDANTFEIYDVVLNSYNENINFSFSLLKSLFSTSNGYELILYNLETKERKVLILESSSRNIVFSRDDNKIALQIGTTAPVIMDYNLGNVLDTILYIGLPQISTNVNNLIYFGVNRSIALIKPEWNKISSIEDNENEIIISPNPTNGLVNITLDCQSPQIKYRINNTSGQNLESKIISNNSSLVIDFNHYPVGIYYLTVVCNRFPKTYKVVKEG